MTTKSVGSVALKMVEEVCRQFSTILMISANTSINDPSWFLIFMLTSLIVGIFFGVITLSSVLVGSLVSGVQQYSTDRYLYINGAAWNNAKKYIEMFSYWKRLKLSSKTGAGT
ncbi:hypothetical protein CTI12_AA476880 [Artemisia annua]|uniref:H(+)-exporting diphosphatase n=1 Tax=Artemisia annua TaxID=35608 RepID=A0A2U1LLU8_ARTAN|nr:hypothetical protein CTI12_AA476880 [Artemisia annua]